MKVTKQTRKIVTDVELIEKANQPSIKALKVQHSLKSADIEQAEEKVKEKFLHEGKKSVTKPCAAWAAVAVCLLSYGKVPKEVKAYPEDFFVKELDQGHWHGGIEYFKDNLFYLESEKYYYLQDSDRETVLKAMGWVYFFCNMQED